MERFIGERKSPKVEKQDVTTWAQSSLAILILYNDFTHLSQEICSEK